VQAKSSCYDWLPTVPNSTGAARRFRCLFAIARPEWPLQEGLFLGRIARHAETRRVEIGGFRTLAGAWAGYRDWTIRNNPRLTFC
jgi:hypothetical protein